MDKDLKLDKSLSQINVWSLAMGSIIGSSAFFMPGSIFLPQAGPLGTAIGMIIGAFIMIVIVISYGYMIKRYPVAGGEFIFAYKGFGRSHAFICGWFLGLSYLSIVPFNATVIALIGRYMFPGFIQQGYMYTVAGWDVYIGEIIFASVVLFLFAIISIKGIRVSGKIQTIMVLALVGSIILLTIVALFSRKSSFENLKPLFSPNNSPLGGVLAIVAIAPFAYMGFDSIPQSSEEFNFSPKKARSLMIYSILLSALMFISLTTVTAIVFPWFEFIISKPFWAIGSAVEHLMGQFGIVILGITIVFAILTGVIGFYMAASRLLFSMARAKVLPKWFGVIHTVYKTPVNSIIFVLIVSLIAPWFGRQVILWVVDMASIGAAIGFFYTTASVLNLLRNKKGYVVHKAFAFIGAILSLGFMILLLIPGMPAYLALPSRVALFIWSGLGVVFYIVTAKYYSKTKKQQDIVNN